MMEYEWDTLENGQDRTARDPEVGIGGDIDFRVESQHNPAVLTLSGIGPDPVYHCHIHGNVSEVIKFDMDGEDEAYCLRCWRTWFRGQSNIMRVYRNGED